VASDDLLDTLSVLYLTATHLSRVTDSRVSTNAPLSSSSPSYSFDLQQIAASLEDKLDIRMNRFEKSLNDMKAFVTPTAHIKAVEEVCVTCGSNHSYNHCPLTRGGNKFPIFHDNIQQFQTAAVGNFVQENRVENSVFDMEEDILFLERLLSEDPLPPINPNQAKSSIKEPEHSFSMRYEHFSTTLVTESDEVVESSIKNLVPIACECEVTLDNESESNEPVKDDSLAFTTFSNPIFNDKDDVTINEDDVPIKESKDFSNPLFDDDEINSDELESHVESNFVESLSTHDAFINSSQKFDHLEEFSGPLIPIHIAKEERIRREHAEYISHMEMLFTINPRPHPTVNVSTIVESITSSLIPVQDNDSQREENDIVTNTNELLPLGFDANDSEGEINDVDDLFDSEESDFDNPSFPRPPPEPPDADFELDSGDEISFVMNTIVEFECLNPSDEFDVSNTDDDYSSFMFVIRIFCFKVLSFLLFAESEDTIFDPGISI
nr:hypothetical protein [Tanacetum cinerariifolium]